MKQYNFSNFGNSTFPIKMKQGMGLYMRYGYVLLLPVFIFLLLVQIFFLKEQKNIFDYIIFLTIILCAIYFTSRIFPKESSISDTLEIFPNRFILKTRKLKYEIDFEDIKTYDFYNFLSQYYIIIELETKEGKIYKIAGFSYPLVEFLEVNFKKKNPKNRLIDIKIK